MRFAKKLILPLIILLVIIGFFYIKNTGSLDGIKKTFGTYSEKASEFLKNIKGLTKFN
jgi:hypothetical protein